jgi:hypothetical protein
MKLRECGWWPKKWTTKNDQDIPSAQVIKDGIFETCELLPTELRIEIEYKGRAASGRIAALNLNGSGGAIGVLWLVLVSVGCYIPDPQLEAILRDASSRKQNAESQNAPARPTLPTHPTVAGTAMTWTNGSQTWAGNPFCAPESLSKTPGKLLSANGPAVDHGSLIPGFHCPKPGSALDQPRMSNGDYCSEWYGSSPDVGACEYVPQ